MSLSLDWALPYLPLSLRLKGAREGRGTKQIGLGMVPQLSSTSLSTACCCRFPLLAAVTFHCLLLSTVAACCCQSLLLHRLFGLLPAFILTAYRVHTSFVGSELGNLEARKSVSSEMFPAKKLGKPLKSSEIQKKSSKIRQRATWKNPA